MLQKHIYAKNLLNHLHNIVSLVQKLDPSEAECYIIPMMNYAMGVGSIVDYNQFRKVIIDQLPSNLGEKVMTLAEQLEAKGEARGKAEGIAEGEAKASKK